jgi:hypothetical protein
MHFSASLEGIAILLLYLNQIIDGDEMVNAVVAGYLTAIDTAAYPTP